MVAESNCLHSTNITSLDLSPITNYTTMVGQTFGKNPNLADTFGIYLAILVLGLLQNVIL